MEGFFGDSTIPPVLGIVLLIWLGILVYLFFIDAKLNKLEKRLKSEFENQIYEKSEGKQ